MKKKQHELDAARYAAWLHDETAFLTGPTGRYQALVRGPGDTELRLGLDAPDVQAAVDRAFFAGAAHLACRPEEVDVRELFTADGTRVWDGRGWENPFRFQFTPKVDLAKRDTLQTSLVGGLGLLLSQAAAPSTARAGTTTTPLSGTASGFLPVTPKLWYRNASIAGLANGATISTWPNSGDLGSAYDLVAGGYAGTAPTKETDSGFAAAFFNGNHGLVFPASAGLTFLPANAFKNWTIFAVYRDSANGNFNFLSRQPSENVLGSVGMISVSGTNHFAQCHTNDGFPVNFNLGDDSAINQLVVRWGSPSAVDGTIYLWRGATAASSTQTWSVYLSDLVVKGIGLSRNTMWNVGYLYEMLVYESALSDTDVNAVRAYLAARFPNTAVAT